MYRIESFLSARLFLVPQLVGERLFFVSNLSGHLSLYGMFYGGSVPEPLLPPHISLHNPHLLDGGSFYVFPGIEKILVMIDKDGDENYQPMLIPITGGFPQPCFNNHFSNARVHLLSGDAEKNLVYLQAESEEESLFESYIGNLETGQLIKVTESEWGASVVANTSDHKLHIQRDDYNFGDSILFAIENGNKRLLYGKPIEDRQQGEIVSPNGIGSVEFDPTEKGLLITSAIFNDKYSLGYLSMAIPDKVEPIDLIGCVHSGMGEMEKVIHLKGTHYLIQFNIDGCTWLYEGVFNENKRTMLIIHTLVGDGDLADGVLEHVFYDKKQDRFVISFSTAITPTQIYTIEGKQRDQVVIHTNERIFAIPEELLSGGEDASFVSFDGTRISARLYMPSANLAYMGPRPLVYYIHGGPQGQERPDFAWFSMPLINFLTLRGFAVFVPNVRGSTGYGLNYTRQVDLDWGGQDQLDHVHAITKVLSKDKRLDVNRAAVVGRSYGGYMTLMLAGQHPNLWKAACDMFGPYDLLTFLDRIPETWKPYMRISLGDNKTEDGRKFLKERSPCTYINNLACPMLVIQGRNDPRVVASESEDLVKTLRNGGKEVELLVFEDEGHDVLKYENKVTCYNAITDFFTKTLEP